MCLGISQRIGNNENQWFSNLKRVWDIESKNSFIYGFGQGPKFIPGITIRKLRGSDHDKEIRVFYITENGIVVYPEETMFTNV